MVSLDNKDITSKAREDTEIINFMLSHDTLRYKIHAVFNNNAIYRMKVTHENKSRTFNIDKYRAQSSS